jgi:hypothetical protein
MTNYGGEYDPGRLRRGAVRAVVRLGPHQYRVAGNVEPWYDVNLELDVPCCCKWAFYHGRGCLHELAARLHDGDAKLLQALGDMLLRAEQAREESERRLEKDLRASLKANRKKKQETAA